jgi:hypothetical protein
MTVFRREADRLDTYLDDQLAGRSVDPDDLNLDPALVETWTWAKTAMAHMPSDPIAKTDTWRTIMHSNAIAAPFPAAAPNPPARRYDDLAKPRWSHRAVAFIGTVTLAAGLAVGIVGYDRFGGGGGTPNEPTSIPAASFFLPGTPEATGCDVPRRESGAIEQIMLTPPSQMPYFPRLNPDPVSQPIVVSGPSEGAVGGTTMWMNSSPDESVHDGIQQMLDTLYACRAYAFDANGSTDMEGSYFSLYSDDYFRRELNGYEDAGQPLQLSSFWLPATEPVALETRKLMDGERYLVVLDETIGNSSDLRVLSVVAGENGAWYIDEVGRMTEPQVNAAGTPIVDQEEISARATEYAATPAADRFPHELTVSVADLALANQDPWTCDVKDGTPIPCTSNGLFLMGPWAYNEIPANLPFTFTFMNTSEAPTHISSPELGIDVELPAGEQVAVEVDAGPGSYEVVFTQGDATSTWTFEFVTENNEYSMG